MKHKVKTVIFTLSIITAAFFCVKYPADIGMAVSLSVERCISVIIPSMYIFMCLTSIAVSSGIHSVISYPFTPAAKYIFRMEPKHFGIFILSMFSGYPAGIKLLTDCLNRNEINEKEFYRLSCFCFASGPAFISGIISGVIFPGTSAGTICFISITAGNLAAAFVTGLFCKFPKKKEYQKRVNISSQLFIDSILSSAHAMFQMCVTIIAFGGAVKAAELSGAIDFLSGVLSKVSGLDAKYTSEFILSFIEISNIINMPQDIGLLPVITALLSFGGICVLMQIMVISKGRLKIKMFLISRLFSAVVSAFVCRLLSRFFNLGVVDAFAPKTVRSGNDIVTAILIFVMTVMLLSLSNDYRHSDKKVL